MVTDFKRAVARALLCSICIGVAACAATPVSAPSSVPTAAPDSTNPLHGITTISIDPVITPGRLFFETADARWNFALSAALGGPALAGLAASEAASAGQSSSALFKATLEKNNIDILAIVLDKMRSALNEQNRFHLVDGDADAVLKIAMKNYGLGVRTGFTDKMGAVLRFEATLTDRDGHVLYQRDLNERNTDETRFTPDELAEDPQRIRAAFEDTASRTGKILSDSMIAFSEDPDAKAPGQKAPPGSTTRPRR